MILDRRIHGIVTAELRAQVEAGICSLLGSDFAGSLCRPLSPTGEEPATHYGGSTAATQEQCDAVVVLLDPSRGVYGFPGWASGVDTDEDTVKIEDPQNMPPADGRRVVWTFEAALASLGLRIIEPGMP